MKHWPILIVVLFSAFRNVYAQTSPAGVANAITLGDKEGYTGSNYTIIYHAPSGKVYTRTYEGDLAIHGNNYTIPLTRISRQPAINGFFLEINNDEAWYYDSKKVVILRSDTVHKIIQLADESFCYNTFNKGILFVLKRGNEAVTLFFNGTSIDTISKNVTPRLTPGSLFTESLAGKLYLINPQADSLYFYQVNNQTFSFDLVKSYKTGSGYLYQFTDENNFYFKKTDPPEQLLHIEKGSMTELTQESKPGLTSTSTQQAYPYGLLQFNQKYFQVINIKYNQAKSDLPIYFSNDITRLVAVDSSYGSFYSAGGNKPTRVFTTVKKYPSLFNQSHSNSIFSLHEDNKGAIWAGSYQGDLSVIRNNKITSIPGTAERISNGGSSLNSYTYLVAEGSQNGLLQVNEKGESNFVARNVNGFYTYVTKDKKHFYFGTGNYNGLWETPITDLENGKPIWNKIDSTKGAMLNNIITITEDAMGRIWAGHPKRGILVYNGKTGKAKTWLVDKNETPFGAYSSITDNRGTVWMGSGTNGLWYYNDYTKEPAPACFKRIEHPLLHNGKPITALTQYKNWLVISAYDKMLLLNLDSFYTKNRITLRYLNPLEAGFTSFTEQNTLLTAEKDSTVWFSTGDMLYQWDLNKWLNLPSYKVNMTVLLKDENNNLTLDRNNRAVFKPGFHSFDLEVRFLSPDNMPRYSSFTVIREKDSIRLPEPSLQNTYTVHNLSSGHYRFIVDVYEMDGSTSRYEYPFTIKTFLWKQWWFWTMLSIAAIGISAYFINQNRKRQLAEERAKTKEAELISFKNEQQKKLAALQLVTLSSQFRPHFILNALNTIGAQMDNNPEAESVLSRLGESVSLIFNHAQQQKTLHSFENEWKLVNNVIHIHRLMYLKELETEFPDPSILERIKDTEVPLGILQIPVENALLHGLSNKETGPWKLSITITDSDKFIDVSITDNGVGRIKSATMSNFTKHGTGTKNLNEIINIINATHADKISIRYEDAVLKEGDETFGTVVIVKIPKQLQNGF